MDFTLRTYSKLIEALQKHEYLLQTFSQYLHSPGERMIILRHDVDQMPLNSLTFAQIQYKTGIKGTYYFRTVGKSWNEAIIREIARIGHEIGYHYEDVSVAAERQKIKNGLINDRQDRKTARPQDKGRIERELAEIAIINFKKNLQRLRELAPVRTICMHGNPMSRWDSRLLWKYYDYHDFGIIGEPYFDIDFNKVLYLTDTGRRWDGGFVSVRDKALSSKHRAQGINPYHYWKIKPFNFRQELSDINILPSQPPSASEASATEAHPRPLIQYKFHSTSDIIKAAEEEKLPDKIMMTFHPQRWTDRHFTWLCELVLQNIKNTGKYFIVKSMN